MHQHAESDTGCHSKQAGLWKNAPESARSAQHSAGAAAPDIETNNSETSKKTSSSQRNNVPKSKRSGRRCAGAAQRPCTQQSWPPRCRPVPPSRTCARGCVHQQAARIELQLSGRSGKAIHSLWQSEGRQNPRKPHTAQIALSPHNAIEHPNKRASKQGAAGPPKTNDTRTARSRRAPAPAALRTCLPARC